jgi:hypothetical protein
MRAVRHLAKYNQEPVPSADMCLRTMGSIVPIADKRYQHKKSSIKRNVQTRLHRRVGYLPILTNEFEPCGILFSLL